MQITYIGHATLLLEIAGVRVLTDPNFEPRLGRFLPRVTAPGLEIDALAKLDSDLLLGRSAVGLDMATRQVLLDGGDRIDFDGLVIATGVTPRSLPGADLAGIHLLRSLDDALSLRAHLLERHCFGRGPH